jgi:hypothetical protein
LNDSDNGNQRGSTANAVSGAKATRARAIDLDLDAIVQGPRPLVGLLIAAWYEAHLAQGGAPDPVQEDLLEETRLEMEHGGGFTYPPGHA